MTWQPHPVSALTPGSRIMTDGFDAPVIREVVSVERENGGVWVRTRDGWSSFWAETDLGVEVWTRLADAPMARDGG